MKSIIVTITICAAIVVLSVSCVAGNNGYTIHEEDVHVEGYKYWREYFVSQDKDTLALSVHYRQWRKQNPCLRIDFCQDMKQYQRHLKKQKNTNGYRLCSYQDFLLQLEACLKEAGNDFDLSRIASIEIFLLDNLPQIAIEVSRQLTNENMYSHMAIDTALEQTSFKTDLNRILQNYNLGISEMKSVEMVIPIDADEYAQKYDISRDILPEKIIGVEILVKLKRKN